MAQVDLTQLNHEQLLTLAVTIPQMGQDVNEELERRTAFSDIDTSLHHLAVVTARVEAFLVNTRHTESVRAFIDMGVPSVLKRVLATCRRDGISWEKPSLEELMQNVSLKGDDPTK
jgi:hypothetical protein